MFNYYTVTMIQRVNRQRVISFKYRLTFLEYYWENMKVDISKVLLSYTEDKEAAAKISSRVFSIKPELKIRALCYFVEFVKQSYIIKFFTWRQKKVKFFKQKSSFDFDETIAKTKQLCLDMQYILLDNIDKTAAIILTKQDGKTKKTVSPTKLTMKGMKFEN